MSGRTASRSSLPLYLVVRFLSEAATMALSVAVGWTLYRLSQSPLALGIAGLVQFIPTFLLTLPAGELCDRTSPRQVLLAGLLVEACCCIAFLMLALGGTSALWPFYAVLLLLGAAGAFSQPAAQALLPFLVADRGLPKAVAWSSTAWQSAVIAGPVLGGLGYAIGPGVAFGGCAGALLVAVLGVAALGSRGHETAMSPTFKERIGRTVEGVAFIRSEPILLGAISLDLFAVLLGGATALLPVYARDILHAGPTGLGLLRSGPALGACIMGLWQVRRPPERRVGLTLFAAVAGFGFATLIFAFSTSLIVSLIALTALGASDMVSVNIRSSLVLAATPETMRGRVSAVNMLFIGASSELGTFESGVLATLVGTVPAVALGGLGTLAVAAIWMMAFPALRRADRIIPAKA